MTTDLVCGMYRTMLENDLRPFLLVEETWQNMLSPVSFQHVDWVQLLVAQALQTSVLTRLRPFPVMIFAGGD